MSKINDYLKTIILATIILLAAPFITSQIQYKWSNSFKSCNKIGHIAINESITNASPYRKDLINYFKDPSIKAILLTIESNGGAAGSCQALAFDIEQLKKEFPKPIVTYTENMCIAGAYEIAAATDYIVTTGSAVIGNIGSSITTIFKIQDFLKLHNGIQEEAAHTQYEESEYQPHKKSINPFDTMNDKQNTMLQAVADNTYQQLSKEIASKRHLQLNKIDQWGCSKIFTGQQAYDLKLVDALGSKVTAINLIKKNIIPSDRTIEWITPRAKSIFSCLWNDDVRDEDLEML